MHELQAVARRHRRRLNQDRSNRACPAFTFNQGLAPKATSALFHTILLFRTRNRIASTSRRAVVSPPPPPTPSIPAEFKKMQQIEA
jgi:hypothetical protein